MASLEKIGFAEQAWALFEDRTRSRACQQPEHSRVPGGHLATARMTQEIGKRVQPCPDMDARGVAANEAMAGALGHSWSALANAAH